MTQRSKSTYFFFLLCAAAVAAKGYIAFAATDNVAFDAGAGALSVSGNCSANYVLVVIRKSSDGSIWGSSNPPCVKGAYAYRAIVPGDDRMGGAFIVDVMDSESATQALPAKSSGPGAGSAGQSVTFAPPAPSVAADPSIVFDAASVAPPDDQSFLDSVLSKFFGIVADVSDAVQSFGAIFANSVKASLVAAVDLFSKTITIIPDGSITVPRGANQMAGADWLDAGAMDVFIPNTLVASSSEVIITPTMPTDMPLVVTEKQDGVGFRVGISRPAPAAISFDWLVIRTYSAAAPSVAEQSVSLGGPPGGGFSQPANDPPPAPAPDPATGDGAASADAPTSTDALPPDPATSSSIDVSPLNDTSSSIDVSGSAPGMATTISDASDTTVVSP